MEFGFSEEQETLRSTVRTFLEQKSPEAEVRRLMETETGYDPAVWEQLSSQLGLPGLAVPEQFGGSGYSFRETAIVLEEMGRALLCAPFFSSAVLASSLLLHCGDDGAREELLPGLASGRTLGTVAFVEGRHGWDASTVETTASGDGDDLVVTGTKDVVLDGHLADLILVVATTAAGPALFAVAGDAPGLTRTPLFTMDQTRKLARLELDAVPARAVGDATTAPAALERMLQLAAVGLAHEEIGIAQRCLEMSVQYAKDRIQFGRPIGSFQAVKHKCADMLVAVELSKSAAHYAAWCAATLDADLPVAAAMAKAYCSDACYSVTAETIQVHGGIGFTWEHPAHLYFKRAKSSQLLLGDPRHHRRVLADHLHF